MDECVGGHERARRGRRAGEGLPSTSVATAQLQTVMSVPVLGACAGPVGLTFRGVRVPSGG